MRLLVAQTLTTTTTGLLSLGIGSTPTIRAIEMIKSTTTPEQCIVYMPHKSESAAAKNRIVDITVGRSTVAREYDPAFIKHADTSIQAVGTTNMTLLVWGD